MGKGDGVEGGITPGFLKEMCFESRGIERERESAGLALCSIRQINSLVYRECLKSCCPALSAVADLLVLAEGCRVPALPALARGRLLVRTQMSDHR